MSEAVNDHMRVLLRDIAEPTDGAFVDGPFGSNLKSDEYVESGVRLIQLQNIGDGYWKNDNKKFITDLKFRSLARHGAIPGDIAIAKMADPVARACIVPHGQEQYVVVADCIRLRVDEARFDPSYIVRAINSHGTRTEAERKSIGSTRVRINLGTLKTIGCLAPPLNQQQAIAAILDTLDTTIRQTEAIIEKLNQVKQGLLHDLLTRGIDPSGELRPPQSQEPHLYKDSPLGWIPREWTVGSLSSWLDCRPKNGYSPQPAGRWTGIQMLGLGCLTANGFEPRQLKDAPLGDPLVPRAFLTEGDLLMSRANTRELVGLVGTYCDVGTPCCYPDLMMRLTPNAEASAPFLELVLRSPRVRRQIQACASGTSGSMVKISSNIVWALGVAMPALAEQRRILDCLDASEGRLSSETAVKAQLRSLKSGLMDDLLTGRVRVTPLLNATP